MTNCCNHRKTSKSCKRIDGKVFKLPRKFTKDKCKRPRGFTMKSSCSPYKFCKKFRKTRRRFRQYRNKTK